MAKEELIESRKTAEKLTPSAQAAPAAHAEKAKTGA